MAQTKVKDGLLNFPDRDDFIQLPSGTTAQRPSSPEQGYSRYNTTDKKLEFWNGTIWQQLPGLVPPIITSLSYPGDDLAADPVGGQTITINGGDFKAGATVTIGGTTPSVITFVSATEITFEAPAKAAGDYDVVVTNVDGGNATSVDGMSYNGVPSWTTAAGNLGTFPAGSTIPTITLVATEPDSGTISYSVTTGSLPTGLTLTGADIDGSVPTPAGDTTYNFSVTASDDENQESTERAFNIVVYLQVTNTVSSVDPFGDSSGVTLYRLENNANDEGGVYNGTPTNVTYSTGVFGQAGVFNGSNSNITSSAGFTGNPVFSLSFWVNPSSNSGTPFLFGNSSSGQAFLTYINPSNKLNFGRWGDSLGDSIASVPNNTWTHIAISNNSGNVQLYINGKSDLRFSTTYSIASNNFYVGSAANTSQYLNGSIDQVRIFNKAITPLEVQSLYQERVVICGGQAKTVDILGDNSCIALYPLDGNANDLSGNYSGTPTDVSYGVGEFDLAGVFNGSSSIINIPNVSAFDVNTTGEFSISAWIKPNEIASRNPIFCSTSTFNPLDSSYVDYRLTLWTNGFPKMDQSFGGGSGTQISALSTVAATVGVWNHVVGTIKNSGEVRVYLNGVLRDSNSAGSTTRSSFSPTLGVYGSSHKTNGLIDQVRIFNKELSSSEVTTLYNETACDVLACSGTTNTLDILGDSSCIAAYPLDGSPLDLSGNYNGVQTNVTYPVGKFDLGVAINGVGYIQIPTLTIPNTTTISLWAKPYSTAFGGTLFSAQTSDYRREYPMLIWVPQSATYNGFAVIYTQNAQFITSSSVAAVNVWHHIVCIKNSDGSGSMYVDNVLIGSIGANTTHPQIAGFTLGAKYEPENPFLGDFFPGEIDQVRIFNKALSAGEVTTLYNETACN